MERRKRGSAESLLAKVQGNALVHRFRGVKVGPPKALPIFVS